MRAGVFTLGGVEMEDAGAGSPSPLDRRYGNKPVWSADVLPQLV